MYELLKKNNHFKQQFCASFTVSNVNLNRDIIAFEILQYYRKQFMIIYYFWF